LYSYSDCLTHWKRYRLHALDSGSHVNAMDKLKKPGLRPKEGRNSVFEETKKQFPRSVEICKQIGITIYFFFANQQINIELLGWNTKHKKKQFSLSPEPLFAGSRERLLRPSATRSLRSRDQVEILKNYTPEKAIGELMNLIGRANRTKFRNQDLRPA